MKDVIRLSIVALMSFASQLPRDSRKLKHFSKEQILPPLPKLDPDTEYGDSIPVMYTNDPSVASAWIEDHLSEKPIAVGWDVESSPDLPWRKSDYSGPATVQISVLEASLVFQIAQEDSGILMDTLPVLQDFLADSSIIKAGVGIDQDMIELFRLESSGLDEASARLDLGGIRSKEGRRRHSLKTLAGGVLGVDLPKSRNTAMSNWGQAPLKKKQIVYAARDAWVSAAILHKLVAEDPTTYSTESLLKLVLTEECSVEDLNSRAIMRKQKKTRLLDLIKDENELSEAQELEVKQLKKERKKLAPPLPFIFDVKPLGLEI